jgi:UDP-N-acetylglucosamine 2-epimerase (non-hydrolysing)
MAKLTVCTVLGTRPEIIKLAPLIPLLDGQMGLRQVLLHTGQHYSFDMDAVFFTELGLRSVDVQLAVGSASHAVQTAAILTGVERAILEHGIGLVLVFGDTNSTLGAALAAAKLAVPVVHIEAGCRSFVRTMPEEINRVLVDHCSAQLLAPNHAALQQLRFRRHCRARHHSGRFDGD